MARMTACETDPYFENSSVNSALSEDQRADSGRAAKVILRKIKRQAQNIEVPPAVGLPPLLMETMGIWLRKTDRAVSA